MQVLGTNKIKELQPRPTFCKCALRQMELLEGHFSEIASCIHTGQCYFNGLVPDLSDDNPPGFAAEPDLIVFDIPPEGDLVVGEPPDREAFFH